jgi:precorrin-6Y C5,15-methyltransferase (decarboxylating)
MSERWISIIGIGEDGLDGLTPAAKTLLDTAKILIGGERHLAMVPDDGRDRRAWPSPIRTLIPEIEALRGQRVCVLATGDPMHFGVGTTLLRGIPASEVTIVPGRSAFTMATARLGWTRHKTDCLTLHGRPLELLHAYLYPGAKLLVLTDDGTAPRAIAALLTERGYGPSRLAVLERMDGASEGRIDGTAETWVTDQTANFNTVAIDCIAGTNAAHLTRTPGLPDDAFEHDGQLTKQEVRAITLSALAPAPGMLLWDVGAGCGSIAIEWMRQNPRNSAAAIEHNADRLQLIAANASALGAPRMQIVSGKAPDATAGLEPPDAVFIGGGITTDGLIKHCWNKLKPVGRLVANVVTTEGERILSNWRENHGGDLRRISIERAEPVGRLTGWRPAMTVTQYIGKKS